MRSVSFCLSRKTWNLPCTLSGWVITGILVLFGVSGVQALESPQLGAGLPGRSSVERSPFNDIPSEGLHFQKGILKTGQSMGAILDKWKVPPSLIHEAAMKARGCFDVRKMRKGQPYWVISSDTTEGGVRYFIYEQSAVDYVVFDLAVPVNVYTGTKQVDTRPRKICARINTSLWQALSKEKGNSELAFRLCDIFAWTVDFHHLARGDEFRVLFEEETCRGKFVGVGPVKAAKVTHRDASFYAFYFCDGNTGHYYDARGRSLQKAFLKAPVKYTRISSGFSRRRLHPVLKVYRPHPGIDYAAPKGTPIMSVGDGVVLRAAYNKTNGNYVKIRHGDGYVTQYLHMCRFHPGTKPGAGVQQGQVIGYVGSTGLATGPHVDFRCWKEGKLIDLSKIDLPTGKPVSEDMAAHFSSMVKALKAELDGESGEDTPRYAASVVPHPHKR